MRRRIHNLAYRAKNIFWRYHNALSSFARKCTLKDFAVSFLNLDSRTDRKKNFEFQIQRVGVLASRFPATRPNPATIFDDFPFLQERHFSYHMQGEHHPVQFNVGALGCYLSHRAFICQLTDDIDYSFLFEDDVIFDRLFFPVATAIARQLRIEWDILLFDCHSSWNPDHQVCFNVYRPNAGAPSYIGTHATLIRNSSRERIRTELDHSYIEAIDTLYLTNHTEIRCLVVRTGLCRPGDFSSDVSLVQDGN